MSHCSVSFIWLANWLIVVYVLCKRMSHTQSECRAFPLNPIHVRPSGELRLCWEAELDMSLIELRLKDILQAMCYRHPILFRQPCNSIKSFGMHVRGWSFGMAYLPNYISNDLLLSIRAAKSPFHAFNRRHHTARYLIDLSLFSFY